MSPIRKVLARLRELRAARDRNRKRLYEVEREIKASVERRRRLAEKLVNEEIKGAENRATAEREVAELHDKIERLERERGELRGRLHDLVARIGFFVKRLKRQRRKQRKDYSFAPGPPDWGGSRYFTDRAIAVVDGRASVTSRKRVEDYGNPGSDHLVTQLLADAVDFGIANAKWLAEEIARAYGITGELVEYRLYTVFYKGQAFRVQFIWSTHGTGPHLHVGIERI